jgi:hypothetical protein
MRHENQHIESVSRFFCESAKLLGYLVDLIGIEPMTSSMPITTILSTFASTFKRSKEEVCDPHWTYPL